MNRVLKAVVAGGLMASLAASAGAEPTVTYRITTPRVPPGLVMRMTEDCRVESSSFLRDARRICEPGFGWQVTDAAGAVLYPKQGYLPPDLRWAFAGPGVAVFSQHGDVTLVTLPAGDEAYLGRGDVEQISNVEGLAVTGVVWVEGSGVRPLLPDGTLGAAIPGADMSDAEKVRGQPCQRAGLLAMMKAEKLRNSMWALIIRRTSAQPGQSPCERVFGDRLAGLGGDGVWRPLDPSTFMARGSATYDNVQDALAG